MLALDLGKIRTAHERFESEYLPQALAEPGDDYRIMAPVTLVFDLDKDKQQCRLVGRIRTTLELTCGRCLEPFSWPVDAEFDLRYQPRSPHAGTEEREIEEDDLTTAFYVDDEIDLGEMMREQFYLSLPMKPLCEVACKGLCPTCGTNLNRTTCGCVSRWEDPRLAALRALKKES